MPTCNITATERTTSPITTTIKRCLSCFFPWIPGILAVSAWLIGFVFSAGCKAFRFKLNSEGLSVEENGSFEDLNFGAMGQKNFNISEETMDTVVDVTGGYQQMYCSEECTRWVDKDRDARLKAVKGLQICYMIIGGFAAYFVFMTGVDHNTPSFLRDEIIDYWWIFNWRCAIWLSVLAILIQGLSFLLLHSAACKDKSVIDKIQGPYADWYDDECTWDSGSTALVISMVLLFMCNGMLFCKEPARRR